MRLLILSDLHRELWKDSGPKVSSGHLGVDVVIMAGDIDTGDKAVGWAQETFTDTPVVYVAGNHEFYGHCVQDAETTIAEAAKTSTNVNYLNCNELTQMDTTLLVPHVDRLPDWPGTQAQSHAIAHAVLADYRNIKKSPQATY